jgi:hypothetical protein
MELPKEQAVKLDSFIKHWVNPSEWYESKEECQKSFLMVAERNNVKPDDVEFVIKKNSAGQMISEPELKNRDNLLNIEDLHKSGDMDRLREFLIQFPVYNNRIVNGENVVDVAISIIKKYSKEEEIRNQSVW